MLEHEQIQGWVSGLYPVLAPGTVTETVHERMGRVLGLQIEEEADVAFLMQTGVPSSAYKRAAATSATTASPRSSTTAAGTSSTAR